MGGTCGEITSGVSCIRTSGDIHLPASGFILLDYVVLIAYLVGIALLGIRLGRGQSSAKDYFLGKERIPWWIVCFSIVAAETSALTFISVPGLSYLGNLNFLQVTLGYLLGRVLVSIFLLPAYFTGEISTAYAFLERRFGKKTRSFASVVFLFTRVAADGVRLFATAIPLKLVFDIEYPVAIVLLALIALAYTTIGGVRGVIWVDAIQMFVYLAGGLAAAAFLAADTPGGMEAILGRAAAEGKLQIFNLDFAGFWSSPYTLIGGLAGGALLSMASHGTDQLVVQRLLATKSERAARKALIGSGVIVVVQFAIFLLVGLMLYGHYGGESLAGLSLTRADEIFPMYIIGGLPPGVSGFIIAGLLAAALSTLAGSMSSMASSTVLDLWRGLRGTPTDPRAELRLSRIVTVAWAGLLVISAIAFMNSSQAVVELALSIASFTYGGLLGTFLLGVFFAGPRQEDALAAFVAGILVMVTVIALQLVAWTWYTGIGVTGTIVVGVLLSRLSAGDSPLDGRRRGDSA